MKGKRENSTRSSGTILQTKKEGFPRILVEKGEVYFLNREIGKIEKRKNYVITECRDQRRPITIGRIVSETVGSKDILLTGKYECVSRDHCEIFFDRNANAYFLLDYSLNGTLINAEKVGGNRNHERRRLKHEDLIEVPAVGEKVKLRFLEHKQDGILDYIGLS
jgi:pSer/pThr/pTyr-binding forkhead associated (FHA) protein